MFKLYKNELKKYINFIVYILIFSVLNLSMSCTTYFKKGEIKINPEEISKLDRTKKIFFVHHNEKVWHILYIDTLNETEKVINMTIDTLLFQNDFNNEEYPSLDGDKVKNDFNKKYKTNEAYYYNFKYTDEDDFVKTRTEMKKDSKEKIDSLSQLYQVHFFISERTELSENKFSIQFKDIEKIDVYSLDAPRTLISYFFGFIGISSLILGVLVLIIAVTKSSCPLVYSYDGEQFIFEGEMFGGAIYKSLERDDFMPLQKLKLINDEFKLVISNELKEKQYINLAKLKVIEHPKNTKVLLDKYGKPYTISIPEEPILAKENNEIIDQKVFSKIDNNYFFFLNDSMVNDLKSNLFISFAKPKNSKQGKLILNVKNTMWLDYLYGKFNEEFGIYFNKFNEEQNDVPFEKHMKWSLAQGIPLTFYLETDTGWKFIDYIQPVGPLANRDLVIPIDLKNVNSEKVNIKIESGYNFWEIDYLALDFSENLKVKTFDLEAISATDENGKDIKQLINLSDNNYLYQPEIGNKANMTYKAPKINEDLDYSYFLHSRGYYEYIRDFSGIPSISVLKSFEADGALIKYSKEYYNAFKNNKEFIKQSLSIDKFKK